MFPQHLVCIDHLNSRAFLISHGKTGEIKDALQSAGRIEVSELRVCESRTDTTEHEHVEMEGAR